MNKLLDLVSPLQGTDSAPDFSRGNTLPLVCTPWPMTAWTLQTGTGRWAFRWSDAKIQGIRATHQPSPWMGDHGHFTLLPQTGERLMEATERAAGYRKEDLVVRPDYLSVSLVRYGCRVELVPTERCCKMRFHFGEARHGRVIVDCFDSRGALRIAHDGRLVFGSSAANDGGVPDNFRLTFCLRLSVPVKAVHGSSSGSSGESGFLGAIEFDIPAGGVVECDVSTSYLGEGQAALNLDREIGSRSFEGIRATAADRWESLLSTVKISGHSERARRTFYSCFYRTLTFPQMMHEQNGEGETVHYSPYNGSKRPGVLYAGHGFWDCYRTLYPLYAILFPERYADILRGWMNACQEGGWYPRWPSPGYRVCMLSTQADVVFADAAVKGVGGFDLAEAYEGLRRHAFEHVDIDAGYGRPGLRDYIHYGFLPADHHRQSVAATLDNAHCDYCLSQIARLLGKKKEAGELLRRSRSFMNLFDPAVGFMRPRNSDGSWVEPFLEFQWGGAYVEGGAWQTSWGVPHDPTGLIHLHGGKKKFLARLNRMFTTPAHFTTGSYRSEIHEMTEMAMASLGQYAHSNQPVHHVLYLFDEAGAPHLTDHWVHRILNEHYNPDPGGFPGDEDNGEMSAWFVLSALGIFPLCPGKPAYKLVTPLFEEACLILPSGNRLEITPGRMPSDAGESCHLLNGELMPGRDIEHAKVAAGGTLEVPASFHPSRPASLRPKALAAT
jgi:predicted alpha-1,2-mannosidase